MKATRTLLAVIAACTAMLAQAQPVKVSTTEFSPLIVYRAVEIKAAAPIVHRNQATSQLDAPYRTGSSSACGDVET